MSRLGSLEGRPPGEGCCRGAGDTAVLIPLRNAATCSTDSGKRLADGMGGFGQSGGSASQNWGRSGSSGSKANQDQCLRVVGTWDARKAAGLSVLQGALEYLGLSRQLLRRLFKEND